MKREQMNMNIGVSPAYITSRYGELFSFDDLCICIKKAAAQGFTGLQLEVFRNENMRIYTSERVKKIKELYKSLNLKLPQFIAHFLGPELASLKKTRKERALETFKNIVQISKDLGTQIIDLPPSIPPELEFDDSLLARPLGAYRKRVIIPNNISWNEIWEDYVNTIKRCIEIVEDASMLLAIEPLPRTIVSNSDAALRLIDSVSSKSLGVCLDTGNLFVQKEILPLTIEKLGCRILSTHLSDNDGQKLMKWAPGKGVIDWREVIKALLKVSYNGSFDLEILGEGVRFPDKEYLDGKKYLEEIIKDEKM